jgi:hypothetical protein
MACGQCVERERSPPRVRQKLRSDRHADHRRHRACPDNAVSPSDLSPHHSPSKPTASRAQGRPTAGARDPPVSQIVRQLPSCANITPGLPFQGRKRIPPEAGAAGRRHQLQAATSSFIVTIRRSIQISASSPSIGTRPGDAESPTRGPVSERLRLVSHVPAHRHLYRHQPVKSIERAGLPFGRAVDGALPHACVTRRPPCSPS